VSRLTKILDAIRTGGLSLRKEVIEIPSSENTVKIRIYPVSERTGLLCQADYWGHEYRRCPFLREGFCKLWGWDIEQRPDQVYGCPVREVIVPIPSDN
jgi:hypothetical protein